MKPLFIAGCLFLLCGCSDFGESNPVGGRFAKSRGLDRSVSTVSVPLSEGHGLEDAYSRKKFGAWSSNGECRAGFFREDTFYACLEFSFSGIPADFDSLRDEGMPDSLDSLHGIDSMALLLRLENSSAYAHSTLEYTLVFMQCRLVSKSMNNGVVRWLDDTLLIPLDTCFVSVPAPSESAAIAIPLKDSTEPLFNYLRKAALERGGSDSAAVWLAVRLADADIGKPLLTFQNAGPAVITLYGHYRPVHYTYINGVKVWGHGDALVMDSVKSKVRISAYSGLAARPAFFSSHPVASTVYYQEKDSLDTAGYYCAVFKVRRDSVFKGLNRDSINVLKARAFLMVDRDSSFSEAGRSMDLRLQCLFYNTAGGLVLPPENVYLLPDTLVESFPVPDSASLCFPIDKYLAALTDPRYDNVALIEFNVQGDPSSFDRMSRLTFKKEVRIDFEYSER